MRLPFTPVLSIAALLCILASCVDPVDQTLPGKVDVIVVDGTITNLSEARIIRLNWSKADPFTGRFGTLPITKATVDVVVDSAQVIACHEAEDGSYQLPNDFKGLSAMRISFDLFSMMGDATNQINRSCKPYHL